MGYIGYLGSFIYMVLFILTYSSAERTEVVTEVLTEVVVCQGETLNIRCPSRKVIVVKKANYGRTDAATCNPNWNTYDNCETNATISTLSKACFSKPDCVLAFEDLRSAIIADNSGQCGETTEGYYLELEYVCIDREEIRPICNWDAISSVHGYITTPNYPDNYDDDKHCKMNLLAFDGQYINISIYDMNLEKDEKQDALCHDHLVIFYKNRTRYKQYCEERLVGLQTWSHLLQEENVITISFESSTSTTFRGFILEYTIGGCRRIDMPKDKPYNGYRVSYTASKEVVYTCNEGYQFEAPSQGLLTCVGDKWIGHEGTCVPVTTRASTSTPTTTRLTTTPTTTRPITTKSATITPTTTKSTTTPTTTSPTTTKTTTTTTSSPSTPTTSTTSIPPTKRIHTTTIKTTTKTRTIPFTTPPSTTPYTTLRTTTRMTSTLAAKTFPTSARKPVLVENPGPTSNEIPSATGGKQSSSSTGSTMLTPLTRLNTTVTTESAASVLQASEELHRNVAIGLGVCGVAVIIVIAILLIILIPARRKHKKEQQQSKIILDESVFKNGKRDSRAYTGVVYPNAKNAKHNGMVSGRYKDVISSVYSTVNENGYLHDSNTLSDIPEEPVDLNDTNPCITISTNSNRRSKSKIKRMKKKPEALKQVYPDPKPPAVHIPNGVCFNPAHDNKGYETESEEDFGNSRTKLFTDDKDSDHGYHTNPNLDDKAEMKEGSYVDLPMKTISHTSSISEESEPQTPQNGKVAYPLFKRDSTGNLTNYLGGSRVSI